MIRSLRRGGLPRLAPGLAAVALACVGLGASSVTSLADTPQDIVLNLLAPVSGVIDNCAFDIYAQTLVVATHYGSHTTCSAPVKMDIDTSLTDYTIYTRSSDAQCHEDTTTSCPTEGILVPAFATDPQHFVYDGVITAPPGWAFGTYDHRYCTANGNVLHCHREKWFTFVLVDGSFVDTGGVTL